MIGALAENVQVAWDGLRANKLRAGLTMLGVVIGVAAVVALLSIGEGARRSITDSISSVGTNLLFVSPGFVDRGPVRGAFGSASTLTLDDSEAIADPMNVPSAIAVAPQYGRGSQIIFGDANTNVEVVGTTPEYLDVFGLSVAMGRFLDERDVDRRSTVAVLGSQVAEDLFGDFDPEGQRIKIALPGESGGRVSVTVIGVLDEQGGSMLVDADDSVYVPISTAQFKLFEGRNPLGDAIVSRINVEAGSEKGAAGAADEITALLTERHRIGAEEDADFTVTSQAEMLELASDVTRVLTIFLGAIAGISLVVGGIGIMNIMLVSVTERTREIGLRKAVGARKSDVLAQFLLESVVLSVLGGIVGVVIGIAVAKVVDFSGLMRAVPSPAAIALALAAALAVGLFFGIYPANRAAGLSPIEALHYE